MVGETRTLAKYASELRFEDLPTNVVNEAKMSIVDTLACSMAGSVLSTSQKLADFLSELGTKGEGTVLGRSSGLSYPFAASVNAHQAWATMMDDSYSPGPLHPGHSVVPTALAVAERHKLSGRDFLVSVVAGYEVGCRIASSLSPSPTRIAHRGITGWMSNTTDALCAAATAARALELNEDNFCSALGIAGSSGSAIPHGIIEPKGRVEGPSSWPWDAGKGVLLGCFAAELANRGIWAGDNMLEGDGTFSGHGYCHLYSLGVLEVPGIPDLGILTKGLGEEYKILKTERKTHVASMGPQHMGINALLDIVNTKKLNVEDIKQITIGYSPPWVFRPPKDARRVYEQFALCYPFGMAVAIMEKGWTLPPSRTLAHLEDERLYEETIRLSEKVKFENIDGRKFIWDEGLRVMVETKAGEIHKKTAGQYYKGHWGNPFTDEEAKYKFRNLATMVVEDARVDRIMKKFDNLEKLDNVTELSHLMRG